MLSIAQRQQSLYLYYMCYTGAIDGIEGAKTKGAYRSFQSKTGLVVDGIYGPKTEAKLIEVIKDIQGKLNNFGYGLVVDGLVGNNTINAVKAFQGLKNLVVDGIVGDQTWRALNSTASTPPPSVLNWNDMKYFKKAEFDCPCCGQNAMDLTLVKILDDDIRGYYGRPTHITSGFRCKNYNSKLANASSTSYHMVGKAADFYVEGISGTTLLQRCRAIRDRDQRGYTYQINAGRPACHLDIGNLRY